MFEFESRTVLLVATADTGIVEAVKILLNGFSRCGRRNSHGGRTAGCTVQTEKWKMANRVLRLALVRESAWTAKITDSSLTVSVTCGVKVRSS